MNLVAWSANWIPVVTQASPAPDNDDVWSGWGSVILAVCAVVVVAAFIAMVVWQGMKFAQTGIVTRAAIAQDEAYRKLAEQATDARQKTVEEQEKIAEALAEVRSRVTSIEPLLRQVD